MTSRNDASRVLELSNAANPENASADSWTASVVTQARTAACTTVGLMCGSRETSDRRVTDRLAKDLTGALRDAQLDSRLLVVRLDIQVLSALARDPKMEHQVPELIESPLGRWTQVRVPMPVGRSAPWTLEQLPRWLPKWKQAFGVILVDLGPMHLVPSRTIGRLCDSCYVLLGPGCCASRDWILQHLAWHAQCGTCVQGSVVTSVKRDCFSSRRSVSA